MSSNDMFEKELEVIVESPKFKRMLEYNPDLLAVHNEDKKRGVLLAFHAFKIGCSEALLDSPMLIGSFIRRVVVNNADLAGVVTGARQDWGPR